MKRLLHFKKPVAACMLLVFASNIFLPSVVYALTSGPTQPEMKGFEPAGTANLVDEFTGDFTYNIPLMDVGGYPINIAYHSGSGMDDEGSWVGAGWSLNPGVIDRQMRGLPDDFKGDGENGDKITKEFNLRKDITGGVDFKFDPEVFGFNIGSIAKVGATVGIFYNNKRGLGVQFGLNANAPLLANHSNTAGTQTTNLSAAANLSFNSQNGASFNPSINYSLTADQLDKSENITSNLNAAMNSRAGLQYVSLGASYNSTKLNAETEKISRKNFNASYTHYAAQTFLPETQANYFNQSYSVSPQFGPELWGFFAGLQLTGHYAMQQVANPFATYNAYGFLHCNEGKKDNNGLMDFNREKDVPYFDDVPNLPVPVATPDLFMVHAQDGSGQYRAYLGGTGIFADHDASNTGISGSVGFEVGAGASFKVGGDIQASLSETSTNRWKTGNKFLYQDNNNYDAYGNFTGSGDADDPAYEPVYFKRVGESVPVNGSIYDKIKGSLPVRIKTKGSLTGATAQNILTGKDNSETPITKKITRDTRDVRNNAFSYLTNDQVSVAGLDKKIIDYNLSAGGFKPFLGKCAANTVEITQPYKKDHHIGEITITDESGSRKIYGIPAYNTYQEDVSFSISENKSAEDKSKGLVDYTAKDASVDNKNGIDHYYSKEMIPGYAHSFLLTGILSPDYVDLKGDGITDDDLGSAIKFNYWRKTDKFQWRTPYAARKANYNAGLISDKMDDRGNYSYGRKELWYTHSIESKTMVAVFETGDREDALGADVMGIKDMSSQNRQQYLKTIRLYSKADWYKDAVNAQPIKTVHFVYDYSLFADPNDINKGVPNNSGATVAVNENISTNQGGKLTLKKIYFTYQNNTKGALQPYEFQYNFNKPYDWKQYDRWGNYKNINDGNPAGVSNDYYAYSTQDKTKADANAALWQLTQIITPAGGIIKVQYESDDYSYVQDKKAMQMYPMAGIGYSVNASSKYYEGDKIYVKLPQSLGSDAELRVKYFDGDDSRNLYFKANVKLTSNDDLYDYVSGYLEIDNINTDVKLAAGYNDVAEIKVKKVKGENVSQEFHPVAKAAWQFMRLNTPTLVYPGYNVREDLAPVQFVKALVGAITSISEILAPFDTRAQIKKLAPEIDLSKSWVRLNASTNNSKKVNGADYYAKLGGGSRVKEISMSDEWNAMSQSAAETATYGMVYDYSTNMTLSNGEEITASSGVASYEPMIGNDENPFHQPVRYEQKIKLGPDNAFFIDEPLCESYFPSAGVGYSKITVRNKGADGRVGATGYSVNEFFTARDYPSIVNHTPIDVQNFGGTNILQMLNIKKNNSRVVSQGYTIELNDMHGKPKAEKVVDKGGNEISAVEYHYKTLNESAPQKQLNNEALVLQKDGTVSNAIIGRDVEMYSDMRSQTSVTTGINVMINIDAVFVFLGVIPIANILPLPNAQYTGFRSASTVKVIQQFGIPDKIIKRQNGSQITTENLAWDANTGEVLLTRSQNEFDDPVYSFSYPSHWTYDDGMGPAYKNTGLMIANFTARLGNIAASAASQLLVSGDELLIKDNAGLYKKYWINNAGPAAAQRLVLIDKDGNPATVLLQNAIVVRSGRRNMHSMAVGSLVSLTNPIKNGRMDISALTRVLDANGNVFNDEWAIEAKNVLKSIMVCPEGYLTDASGNCYKSTEVIVAPDYSVNTTAARQKNSAYATCGTYLTSNANAYLSLATAAEPALSGTVVKLTTPGIWQNGTNACNTGTGTSGDYDGPLNRCGIWPTEKKNNNYTQNEWVGIKTKVYIRPSEIANKSADGKTGTLYLGFGGYNNVEVRIDNVLVAARGMNSNNTSSPYRTWHIKPVSIQLDPLNPLTQQMHEIFIRVRSQGTTSPGVLGAELYNNTFTELANPTCIAESCLPCEPCPACRTAASNEETKLLSPALSCTSPKIIWSTKCLTGLRFNYHANLSDVTLADFNPVCTGGTLFDFAEECSMGCKKIQTVYAAKIPKPYCDLPVGQVINPYTTGLRGNWRMQKSFAYHTDREGKVPAVNPGDPDVLEKTDIRKSGAYISFHPFWKYENGKWLSQENQSLKDANWVKANEMTAFNQKGQEIENVDALNRYSAAQFGYLQSAATAVASNARYTDIAYDGFEDYGFDVDNCNTTTDTCNTDGHFSIRKLSRRYPFAVSPDATQAHTGRSSLKVTNAVEAVIAKQITPAASTSLYSFAGNNSMLLTDKGILYGFKPQPGKNYLLSAWIKDNGADDNSSYVQLTPGQSAKAAVEITTGGVTYSTIKAGPKVEGWRKVEIAFLIPAGAADIKIRFRPGSATAWFDDIRIHPFDAQMKTYAYDNRSMRLWAELDENNFASFYEYDDEGILVRVKKETERGIMTIKETRSTYRFKK